MEGLRGRPRLTHLHRRKDEAYDEVGEPVHRAVHHERGGPGGLQEDLRPHHRGHGTWAGGVRRARSAQTLTKHARLGSLCWHWGARKDPSPLPHGNGLPCQACVGSLALNCCHTTVLQGQGCSGAGWEAVKTEFLQGAGLPLQEHGGLSPLCVLGHPKVPEQPLSGLRGLGSAALLWLSLGMAACQGHLLRSAPWGLCL